MQQTLVRNCACLMIPIMLLLLYFHGQSVGNFLLPVIKGHLEPLVESIKRILSFVQLHSVSFKKKKGGQFCIAPDLVPQWQW